MNKKIIRQRIIIIHQIIDRMVCYKVFGAGYLEKNGYILYIRETYMEIAYHIGTKLVVATPINIRY